MLAEDTSIQAMIAAALKVEGFDRVLPISRQTDLLELANSVLPDVFILDYECPGRPGLQLYEQLQAHGRSIPCIFINAPLSLDDWNHHSLWTLPLPFALEELFRCIKEALGHVSHLSLSSWNSQRQSNPNL